MKVTCFPSPVQKFSKQSSVWEWHFTVLTRSDLTNVAFRNPPAPGCSFGILFVQGPRFDHHSAQGSVPPTLHAPTDHSVWENPSVNAELDENVRYAVRVVFQSSSYGTYCQALEFTSFSGKKKSCQLKATVSPMNAAIEAGIVTLKLEKDTVPVSLYERNSAPSLTVMDRELLEKYSLHRDARGMFSAAFGPKFREFSEDKQLKILLHSFLYVEEAVQIQLVMKYACITEIKLLRRIECEDGQIRVSQGDELYAEIPLEVEIDDDSPEAQVMMSSVNIAYLDLLAGEEVFGEVKFLNKYSENPFSDHAVGFL